MANVLMFVPSTQQLMVRFVYAMMVYLSLMENAENVNLVRFTIAHLVSALIVKTTK